MIGIGLNLWPTSSIDISTTSINELVDREWTDSDTAYLINTLCSTIRDYPARTPADRIKRYDKVSLLNGRSINVIAGVRHISGIARGIDEFGRLCILTNSGAEYLSAGDVSVRPQ